MYPELVRHYAVGEDVSRAFGIEFAGEGWYVSNDKYISVNFQPSGLIRVMRFEYDPRPEMMTIISLPNRVDMPIIPA